MSRKRLASRFSTLSATSLYPSLLKIIPSRKYALAEKIPLFPDRMAFSEYLVASLYFPSQYHTIGHFTSISLQSRLMENRGADLCIRQVQLRNHPVPRTVSYQSRTGNLRNSPAVDLQIVESHRTAIGEKPIRSCPLPSGGDNPRLWLRPSHL